MPHRISHQPAVVTIAVTVVAVITSVAVTQATMWWMGYDAGMLPALLAGGIPAVMVPLTIFPMAKANKRLRRVQGELERLADTDVLTGLPNRRAFFERAERMLAAPSVTAEPVAALMIDVDHFKAINDTHGHGAGDDVLRAIAIAIRDAVADGGPTDWTVARIGGEEFAVLTAGLAPTEVFRLAERICGNVRQLRHAHSVEVFGATISVGVALRSDADIDSLLRAADDAVYLAKQSGRDCWAFAAPEVQPQREAMLGSG
jgi:diguanylate cyclase (GGDEF)-like protein